MGDVNGGGVVAITRQDPAAGRHHRTERQSRSLLFNFFAHRDTPGAYLWPPGVNSDSPPTYLRRRRRRRNITVFSGLDGSILAPALHAVQFTRGVRVATSDINGDSKADIIAGAVPAATSPFRCAGTPAELLPLARATAGILSRPAA